MKAVVKYGFGPYETELRDLKKPVAGGQDILVKVAAAGVCGTDLNLDAGKEPWLLRPPVVLGHEFAGTVVQAGPGSRFAVGDRVVSDNTGWVCGQCKPCGRGDFLACRQRLGLGYGMDGGFASYVRIPGDILQRHVGALFKLPDDMSFEEGAIMDPCANAYRMVIQDAKVKPGEDVAVFGLGPLGLFAIQFAHIAGAASVIAVGLPADQKRFGLARQLGATHCLVSDGDGVAEALTSLSGEISVVVDCAGKNAVLKTAFDILEPGGRFIKVGSDEEPLGFSIDALMQHPISIIGHLGYDYECWHYSLKLYQKGVLDFRSLITHRFPIAQYRQAFDAVKAGEAIKAILVPEQEEKP